MAAPWFVSSRSAAFSLVSMAPLALPSSYSYISLLAPLPCLSLKCLCFLGSILDTFVQLILSPFLEWPCHLHQWLLVPLTTENESPRFLKFRLIFLLGFLGISTWICPMGTWNWCSTQCSGFPTSTSAKLLYSNTNTFQFYQCWRSHSSPLTKQKPETHPLCLTFYI